MAKILTFESEVLGIKDLTDSVRHFKLSVPEEFNFKSGQFISIPITQEGENLVRSYSIASIPKKKGYIGLCIKGVKGIGTKFMFNLKKGDKLKLKGPYGIFKIGNLDNEMVFVATGTGIAPFRSMINELLASGFKKQVTLLTGVKNEEGTLYLDEFNKLQKEYSNFKHYSIFSQPKAKTYKGDKGWVQDLIKKYISEDFKGDFYLCGLFPMIKGVIDLLEGRGVSKSRIYFERFS